MIEEALILNQTNMIHFVMVDANYTEVPGLGMALTVRISKAGGAFAVGVGAKGEMVGGNGEYYYTLTAAECDTIGPLSVRVTGAGCIQQNLEYVVQQRTAGCVQFTYTLTNSVTLAPVADADIWISTDIAGNVVVWTGSTDALGVARDDHGYLPCLDANTYFFWSHKVGFTPDFWPDVEIVS